MRIFTKQRIKSKLAAGYAANISPQVGESAIRSHGIQSVPVRYGKRQIVRASHRPDGKLYTWELPGLLIDRIQIGDKVLAHTAKGIRTVTVAAVEDYAGQEPEPLRTVIRVKKRTGRNTKEC